jgi:hypothetical protein
MLVLAATKTQVAYGMKNSLRSTVPGEPGDESAGCSKPRLA